MYLVKVSSGLIERDDFLITSPFEDFLGNGSFHRDSDSFILVDGSIERKIPYENFLITVDKKTLDLNPGDEFEFYVRNKKRRAGIKEFYNSHYPEHWKLIYNDGYVQGHVSDDNKYWESVGGIYLEDVAFQGFKAKGKKLQLNNYKVYSSPYITISNMFEGYRAVLLDSKDSIIKERVFDSDMICTIYLDYLMPGFLEIYDTQGNKVYRSRLINFEYGDSFMFTKYSLELYYQENLLTYETTTLHGLLEKLVLRNSSSEDYDNIKLDIRKNENVDSVEISLNRDTGFSTSLTIDKLKAGEEIDIYVQIIKDPSSIFTMRDFYLDIS